MQTKPLEILVTNDDGYRSKGISVLAQLLSFYGNVTVLAPEEVQSGKSAALTMEKPLRLEKISCQIQNNGNSILVYSLNGTPADCVKMAMNKFFDKRKPDILCSGINHGSNASVASVYSGTLGAAAEGTLYGVPSIGLSIDTHIPSPDFSQIEDYIKEIIEKFISAPPKEGVFLNVNFPAIPKEEIKGITFAKQGNGMWIKEFEQRTDPHGRDYYWMTGEFLDKEENPSGDHKLLKNGYITIVPHNIDNTDYTEIERLGTAWNTQK